VSDKTKKGVPTQDFTDAGTRASFAKGEEQGFDLGTHANYLAAGLISEPDTKAPAKTAS
jgi:hypothetical protein